MKRIQAELIEFRSAFFERIIVGECELHRDDFFASVPLGSHPKTLGLALELAACVSGNLCRLVGLQFEAARQAGCEFRKNRFLERDATDGGAEG